MSLFDFDDYRDFLSTTYSGTGVSRGTRVQLAQHLNCQPTHLTQVFSKKSHLSLEHALRTAEYLNFNSVEIEFFMLLVQKDKAGEYALSQYFQGKLLKIRQQRSKINQRIKVHTTLSVEDQMTYYSTWYYAAIHILVSVPGYQTVDAIASRLKLNARTVTSALSFLVVRGFVLEDQNTFSIGKTRMHLDKTNRMLPRHHSNWRMRALDSVDNDKVDDLHYTSVLGISKKDMKRFKEELLNLLEKFEPVIQESIQDTQVIFLLDLFET